MQMASVDEENPILEALLAQMVAARKCANEMLRDSSSTCFGDVQKVRKANASLLISMDPSLRLELSWLSDLAEACYV
eukprot:8462822-Alexandrium_andersonii.AAC.1